METIAAIATPPGRGAIAIVRCSGPDARQIVARVFRSRAPLADRVATYGEILDVDGAVLDRGLALAMDAPRTVTGEDVVELHVHGSPVVARETLRALLHAGARAAGPGEFTRRAFLNGKLDLSAAEAVADVIDAESRAGARAAQANLTGGLRAAIDAIAAPIATVLEELAGAIGRLVREGLTLAIVGPPNAGKSSLLNALLGEERAIVAAIAGTTRDVIEERFFIDGIAVRVLDTAGLRESDDPVERIGIERARRALEGAAVALVVIDGARPLDADAQAVLFNKSDLGRAGFDAREAPEADALLGSVLDAATIAALQRAVAHSGWGSEHIDLTRAHLASARQADAVARARESLQRVRATLDAGDALDLIAPELLAATAALGEITGAVATEAILDGVFARFCIGK